MLKDEEPITVGGKPEARLATDQYVMQERPDHTDNSIVEDRAQGSCDTGSTKRKFEDKAGISLEPRRSERLKRARH